MTREYRRLFGNFISLVIVQGGTYIIPLVTMPYLVSVLGVDGYGIIAYALAFCNYFVVIADFGLNLYAPKEIAQNIEDQQKVNELFSSILIIKVVLVIAVLPLLLFITFLVPSLSAIWPIVLLTYGFVVGITLFPIWFFQGIEKMSFITSINLSVRVFYAVAIFIWINDPGDIWLVPMLNALSFIVAAVIGLYFCFRITSLHFYFPPLGIIRHHMKASSSFFLSRVSLSLYTLSNTFVIGTFGTMEATGIYSVAEKLYDAVQGMYHPLMNALYPFIARKRDVKIFLKILFGATLINVVGVVIMYHLAYLIFDLVFTDVSNQSIEIFKGLILVTIILIPSILLGYPFLAAMGHPKYTNMSVVVSSVIHMVNLVALVLLDQVELMNIVIIVFVTQFLVFSIRLYGTFRFNLWSNAVN